MKARPQLIPLALSFFISLQALAAPRPFDCTNALKPAREVEEAETFRQAFTADTTQIAVRKEVVETLEATLKEALVGSKLKPELQNLVADIGILVDNPIFDEALARALRLADVKNLKSVEDFKLKLRTASEQDQLEFASLVVRQYTELFDKAFAWVDEDQFIMLEKRWGMKPKEAYLFLNRWSTLNTSHSGELALGVLAWAKAIDGRQITEKIRTIRNTADAALKDSEEVMVTRIKKPHSELDLALNTGPLSDGEFARKMRFWNAWGWTKHKLNILRYPNEASFVIILSIVPVSIVHGLVKDWNLTNTVATIIGGVATCPPLIAKLTRSAVRQNHDAVWLETLTLKQLSEFKRWIENYPSRATELGFNELGKPIEQRIEQLRKLRYSQLGK